MSKMLKKDDVIGNYWNNGRRMWVTACILAAYLLRLFLTEETCLFAQAQAEAARGAVKHVGGRWGCESLQMKDDVHAVNATRPCKIQLWEPQPGELDR